MTRKSCAVGMRNATLRNSLVLHCASFPTHNITTSKMAAVLAASARRSNKGRFCRAEALIRKKTMLQIASFLVCYQKTRKLKRCASSECGERNICQTNKTHRRTGTTLGRPIFDVKTKFAAGLFTFTDVKNNFLIKAIHPFNIQPIF